MTDRNALAKDLRAVSLAAITFARSLCLASAVACVGAAAALAAEPRTDATIKNKNVEASVLLDDKIKADAALAADCLAEGKKWIDKNAADAEASRKQDPVLFRNGGWTFERKYTTRSLIDGRYVSIIRSDYANTGGAHPNSDVDTILWDAAAQNR